MSKKTDEYIKNLAIKILRKKQTMAGDCVLFVNQSIYDSLEKAGLVIHWTENYPGAIWMHCNICGLPVVIDQEVELFTIMPQCEARERIDLIMF